MAPIDRKLLVEFFSRSLSAFQSSNSTFEVLCTLPHPHQHAQPQPGPRRPDDLRSLIVLDSSFNPPTVAHAQMAKDALRSLSGARIVLLLSVNNADKAPQPASFPQRLGMMAGLGLELLEEAGGDMAVDLAVTTMPFFHDKARAMVDSGFYSAAEATPRPPTQIFLAGFDTLTRIFDPKYYGGRGGGMRAALGPFFAGGRAAAHHDAAGRRLGPGRGAAAVAGRAAAGGGGVEGERGRGGGGRGGGEQLDGQEEGGRGRGRGWVGWGGREGVDRGGRAV